MRVEHPAFCADHPDVLALGTCGRCGSFVCERCAQPGLEAQLLGLRCLERSGLHSTPRAVTALVLATLTFLGGVPGVFALILANAELREAHDGKVLPDGVLHAKLARSIALMELGALIFAALVYAAQRLG